MHSSFFSRLIQLSPKAKLLFSFSLLPGLVFSQVIFGTPNVVSSDFGTPHYVYTSDMDTDGDLDIIYTSGVNNYIAWHNNENGFGEFSIEPVVTIDEAHYGLDPRFVDLNGDGYVDVLYAGDNLDKAAWRENIDGSGNFGDEKIISAHDENVNSIQATDLDSDGDLDVIFTVGYAFIFAWCENLDGLGTFGPLNLITDQLGRVKSAHPEDLDGDGKVDLIVSSSTTKNIYWFRNEDGLGSFEAPKILAPDVNYSDMHTVDLDGDGDKDILTVKNYVDPYNGIVWYENENGLGDFGSFIPIGEIMPGGFYTDVADIDGDGDLDVLAGLVTNTGNKDMVAWHENTDGFGQFSSANIISDDVYRAWSVHAADLDSDGDFDALYASGDDKIVWFENLVDNPTISGTCFFDQNQNKQRDPAEVGLLDHSILIAPDALASFSNTNGVFKFVVDNGNYTIAASPNPNWDLTTDSSSYQVSIQDTLIQNLDFGFIPNQIITKVEPTVSSAPTRCGFEVPFWLNYKNTGTTFSTGYISFQLDPHTTLLNAVPMPDSVAGNVLFWKYEELPPSYLADVELLLQMPGVNFIGDTVRFTATSHANDANGIPQANTTFEYPSIINCAYDPNDKLVQPEGIQQEHLTLLGEKFEYTVRFQNTGTDTAFTVRIEDRLDDDLDWTTFRPIAASHHFETTLRIDGLVEFLFRNILLPDSTTNEPASHGFVKYRIQHKEGLPEHTEITNDASIFFDFNPPIVTNTTLNTLVSEIVNVDDVEQQVKVKVAPNPFEDFTTIEIGELPGEGEAIFNLLDINGRVIKRYLARSHTLLKVEGSHVPSGIYFYVIKNKEGIVFSNGKIIKM